MNERDELAALIYAAEPWANGTAYNAKPYEWEELDADDKENFTPLADAILAAGYRRPRTITTVEELDALGLRSIVRDGDGETWELTDNGWRYWVYGDEAFTSHGLTFPATVLHEPEPLP
jgi:hypothetical protein